MIDTAAGCREWDVSVPASGWSRLSDLASAYSHPPRRCDEEEVEEQVKKDSTSKDGMGAKTLCIPLEQPDLPAGTKCFVSGKPAKNWALWGRSY